MGRNWDLGVMMPITFSPTPDILVIKLTFIADIIVRIMQVNMPVFIAVSIALFAVADDAVLKCLT